MIIHLPSCPVSKHDHYVIDSRAGGMKMSSEGGFSNFKS